MEDHILQQALSHILGLWGGPILRCHTAEILQSNVVEGTADMDSTLLTRVSGFSIVFSIFRRQIDPPADRAFGSKGKIH